MPESTVTGSCRTRLPAFSEVSASMLSRRAVQVLASAVLIDNERVGEAVLFSRTIST